MRMCGLWEGGRALVVNTAGRMTEACALFLTKVVSAKQRCESPLGLSSWCGICPCGSDWQQCTPLSWQFPAPREVAALQGHLMGSVKVNNLVSVLTHCLPGFCLSLSVCVTEGLPGSWLLRGTSSQQWFQCHGHAVGFLYQLWRATIPELLQWPHLVSFFLPAPVLFGTAWVWEGLGCSSWQEVSVGQRDGCCFSIPGKMCCAQGHADRNVNGNKRQESRRYLDPCDSLVIQNA